MAYVSVCARQGRRHSMEDEHLVQPDFLQDGGSLSLYAVFDGHGGSFVSLFLKDRYAAVLRDCLRKKNCPNDDGRPVTDAEKRYKQALRESFLQCDAELAAIESKRYGSFGGSTAAVVLVDNRENRAYVANAGDAEVVLGKRRKGEVENNLHFESQCLTVLHKPDNTDEVERIVAAGGFVSRYGVMRVNGILAVSRSFGDFEVGRPWDYKDNEETHEKLISVDPHIAVCSADDEDVLVIACDGLWDVYTYDQAVLQTFVAFDADRQSTDTVNVAENLCLDAIKNRRSTDNVSVIVVRIGQRVAPSGPSVVIADPEEDSEDNWVDDCSTDSDSEQNEEGATENAKQDDTPETQSLKEVEQKKECEMPPLKRMRPADPVEAKK